MFAPHIIVVQQGTTVEFLNSDNVQHNVFWTAVGSDKKAGHNLGTWPKGEKRPFTFDKAGRRAAALQRASGDGGIYRRQPNPVLCRNGRQRQLQDQRRSRRQLHARRLARRREEPVQAGHRCRWRQSGLHSDEIRSRCEGAASLRRRSPHRFRMSSKRFSQIRADMTANAEAIQRQKSRRGLAAHQLSLHDGLPGTHQRRTLRGPDCRGPL